MLVKILSQESAGGIVMIIGALLALVAANSSLAPLYQRLANEDMRFFVNDIAMVVFFLLVSLELKRETKEGVLAQRNQIILPLLAALGGMVVPALLFYAVNADYSAHHAGWAIPSATDIAFALCILSLCGKHLPPSARIFLMAVAIFDDLGAILVIALFYNANLFFAPLLFGAIGMLLFPLLYMFRVVNFAPYVGIAVYLWICCHEAGVHPTIAGVLLGLMVPYHHPSGKGRSPLLQWMHGLHPWVNFLILPLFAFFNAGVSLQGLQWEALLSPLPLGIILGLLVGKQLGVFATLAVLVRLRVVKRPAGAGWLQLYGISVLAGIGFTMSLFINLLAFEDDTLQTLGKVGVMAGTLLSVLWGIAVLRLDYFLRRKRTD